MDEADKAQARAELANEVALDEWRRRQPTGESLRECEKCGEEIPEKRRQTIKGCRLCVACQTAVEIALKRGC